ncbi:MAG TPA: DNA recombination protein RmuC [Candidatus Saccharimonadales bacterium]|jgi:DNA recombination protein RmuC|nr:DNA recombination protein RmuC [Candidatus Saccharimonadales bacterium]
MLIAAVIIGGLIVVLLLTMLVRQSMPKRETDGTMLLKQDITKLSDEIVKFKDGLQSQITDRMDKNQEMMRESIIKQFSTSSKLIAEVTQKLARLDETNRQVVNVTDELKTLQNVLQNPKQRGVLGEYYLKQVLENVMSPEQFKLQYRFKDGETVDAVIMLDKGKILPIDSKFSLENYNRLINEHDKQRRELLVRSFKADLKARIDETAKYIRPREKTMDFAFMFIPSEAIYNDLLINKIGTTDTNDRDLIEYAYRDKRVIIVSPTTFMAYLQTVMQGLRSLEIQEQAQGIQQRVLELGRHIANYEQFMQKLGGSLGTTVNHFNRAHQELNKVDKDIIKIANTEPSIKPLLLESPASEEED